MKQWKKILRIFFKGLRQFFLKFIYPEAIKQDINGLNKVLITEKVEKNQKNIKDFFKGLRQNFLKFNYPEAISKQLTVLIKW